MAFAKVEIWLQEKARFGGQRFDTPSQVTSHILELFNLDDCDLEAEFITADILADHQTAFKP